MKRKLFIAGATFVLVAAAVTVIAANQQTNKPTLLEANIEALGANGTGGNGESGLLPGSGSAYCKESKSDRCEYNTNGGAGSWYNYIKK